MAHFGEFLYPVLALLLVMFWRARGGLSLDALLARNEYDHHHVRRVLKGYLLGGPWGKFKGWMKDAEANAGHPDSPAGERP